MEKLNKKLLFIQNQVKARDWEGIKTSSLYELSRQAFNISLNEFKWLVALLICNNKVIPENHGEILRWRPYEEVVYDDSLINIY